MLLYVIPSAAALIYLALYAGFCIRKKSGPAAGGTLLLIVLSALAAVVYLKNC